MESRAKSVDIYVKDLRTPDAPIRPIIHGIDSRFSPENFGDDLYVLTDYQADNYRIVKVNLSDPAPEHWETIVPEGKDVIDGDLDRRRQAVCDPVARRDHPNPDVHAGR